MSRRNDPVKVFESQGELRADRSALTSQPWDARNRLVSTLSGAAFQYDAFGRRSPKTTGGTATNFLYDGVNAVQELSGTTPTANLLSGGVNELFQRTDSSGMRNFLTDALGSTLELADSTGTTQTQYTFEPFGNTATDGSATTNSFAYAGRELDGTGLYFNRARYYSPSLQRFISEDPIRFTGGTNLYRYAANDPLDFSDPFGLYDYSEKETLERFLQPAYERRDGGILSRPSEHTQPQSSWWGL
ncbi:MAG TPA: RHS repeat-associated core domain-containing protein [Candidatus Acidoferrum sp.]|nr:RHS repeat-associated core domain-containing protein [Candidatus Acidoferrum sp.]